MPDYKALTVATYNQSAQGLSKYFQGIGPRTDDIDLALTLAGQPKRPRIVEIGCGDGRDAQEIIKRADFYEGTDISEELIKLARHNVPGAHFEVADMTTYQFPANLDIVFAFASLLHISKDEVQALCKRVWHSLRPGGVFFISLKYADDYHEELKQDEFGTRLFYFYNPPLIKKLAGKGFEAAAVSQKTIGHTPWFEVALRKI